MTAVDVDALDAARAAAICPQGHRHLLPVYDLACWLAEVRRGRALREAVEGLAESWTRYPQSPEDRERNRYGAAMQDCGDSLRVILATDGTL